MDTEQKVILQVDTKQSEQSVGSLKGRMKELKNQMAELELQGKSNTAEYQSMKSELGDLSRAYQRVTQDVAEASTTFSNTVQYLGGSLAGVSAGIQTVTGLLAMMGVETDKNGKLMQLMVGAMSVTSGIQTIQASVESFKMLTRSLKAARVAQLAYNAAMNANPYILAASAIIAVGTAIFGLTKWLKKSKDDANESTISIEEFKKKNEELKATIDKNHKNDDWAIRYAKACGKSAEEIDKMRKAQLQANKAIAAAQVNQLAREYKKSSGERKKQLLEEYKVAKDVYNKEVEAYKDYLNEKKIADAQAETDRRNAAKKTNTTKQPTQKVEKKELATSEDYSNTNRELQYIQGVITEYEKESQTLDDMYTKLFDYQAKNETNTKDYLNLLVDIQTQEQKLQEIQKENAQNELNKNVLNANTELITQETDLLKEYSDRKKQFKEDDILAMLELDNWYGEQQYEIQKEANANALEQLQFQFDNQLITIEEYNNEKARLAQEETQIEIDEQNRRLENEKRTQEAKQKINQRTAKVVMDSAKVAADFLGGIADALGEENENYKALKIAEATINTIVGGITAYMSAIKEYGGTIGIIVGAVQAATVLAAGFTEIQKIKQIDAKHGSGGNVSTSAFSSINRGYSNVRLQSENGGNYDLSNLESRVANQKVYVVQSDIEDAHNQRVEVQQQNTF